MKQKEVIEIKKLEQFLFNLKILQELNKKDPKIKLLKLYQGFGGLRQCFNSQALYIFMKNEIKKLFGMDKVEMILNDLKKSFTSAYYTPPEVVKFIYRYLTDVCGFSGGNILEPACGNGIFFDYMPSDIKINSSVSGVETDFLTSYLVQKIYKNISIINKPIETVDFAGQQFDLIIGNPPYGREVVIDTSMPDISNYTIHHYFIAKCIRLLKNNGILAFVMPSYFFDIPRKNTRAIIDREAILIDAFRLPDNLFNQANVTVDIVFFRKTGYKLHGFANTIQFQQDGYKDFINEFWQVNPKRILGKLKLKWVDAYKRAVPTCTINNIPHLFNRLVNSNFSKETKENYNRIIA